MHISLYAYCILGESIIWLLVQFSDGFCDLSCELLPGTCFHLKWERMFNKEWLYQLHINILKNECPSTIFFLKKARRLNKCLHIYTWNFLKTIVFEVSWLLSQRRVYSYNIIILVNSLKTPIMKAILFLFSQTLDKKQLYSHLSWNLLLKKHRINSENGCYLRNGTNTDLLSIFIKCEDDDDDVL